MFLISVLSLGLSMFLILYFGLDFKHGFDIGFVSSKSECKLSVLKIEI